MDNYTIEDSFLVLAPDQSIGITGLLSAEDWPCFSSAAMNFCDAYSQALLDDPLARKQSDIVAFAYWLRASNVTRLSQEFQINMTHSRPYGLSFHIAPGNVDSIFVYSMMLSYVMGNKNIVRVSEKSGVTTTLLLGVLNKLLLLPAYEASINRFLIIHYEHDDDITREISEHCQLRVIWGGDQAIDHIQQLPLNSKVVDVSFPDRYSALLMNAESVLAADDDLLVRFGRDVWPYSQQACSSPKLIFWVGSEDTIESAKEYFWRLYKQVISGEQQNNDLTDAEFYERAQFVQSIQLEEGKSVDILADNVVRVSCDSVSQRLNSLHSGYGVFFEISLSRLADLDRHLSPAFQTLSIYGVSNQAIQDSISDDKRSWLRRLVPVGNALSFSHEWDGINLLRAFSHQYEA